jgi:hypothetical protein
MLTWPLPAHWPAAGAASLQFYPQASQIMTHLLRVLSVASHVVKGVKPDFAQADGARRRKKEGKDAALPPVEGAVCGMCGPLIGRLVDMVGL